MSLMVKRIAWRPGPAPRPQRRWPRLPGRAVPLTPAARLELTSRGEPAKATITRVAERMFTVQVDAPGRSPYEARVPRGGSSGDERAVEAMLQVGDVVDCRVDPGDPRRIVLNPLLALDDPESISPEKILADGRRARATVLAAAPVDISAREPVLRLDLEMLAWDEPQPWHVRIVTPVPLSAVPLAALGQKLVVAFFTVDKGESVAIDWMVSAEMFGAAS